MDEKKTDGFKFAVSTITALLTFSYVLYKYIQNTAINVDLYIFAVYIISATIIASVFFILYLLIKGFSLEIRNPNKRKNLDEFASDIYLASFFISIMTLLSMFILFLAVNTEDPNMNLINFIYVVIILGGTFFYCKFTFRNHPQQRRLEYAYDVPSQKNHLAWLYSLKAWIANWIKTNIVNPRNKFIQQHPLIFSFISKIIPVDNSPKSSVFMMILSFTFFYCILLSLMIPFFMQGYVTVDMENIYYKNDTQIPISIKVTGPNNGIFIKLYNVSGEYNLTQIDSIELKLKHNSNKIEFGKNSFLIGNSLNNGNYNVFINTTNMTGGYYELACLRNSEHVKGFYLLEHKMLHNQTL